MNEQNGEEEQSGTGAMSVSESAVQLVMAYPAISIRQPWAWLIMHGGKDIERGGIVGIAEIVGCVTRSDSRWFVGPYGFVLRNVEPLPFYPCKGALGFFRLRP